MQMSKRSEGEWEGSEELYQATNSISQEDWGKVKQRTIFGNNFCLGIRNRIGMWDTHARWPLRRVCRTKERSSNLLAPRNLGKL